MSAIFGIIDIREQPIEDGWVQSMQANLEHRGPDGKTLYREPGLVLGHMLLSVTPESVYDKGPYEEDGLVIVANARLDEREALMNRLQVTTSEREEITDPVLLLRSYQKWGKDFVKDIYGDFAFAIWDIRKKDFFCARDQIGVKPFLYYFKDNRFVFSTEIKSIVQLPFVTTEIDNLYLRDRSIGICDQAEKTCWKNILQLQTAHSLQLRSGGLSIHKYWSPVYKRNKRFKTEHDSAEAVKLILEKIIEDHTRVAGNVGVPLSGGLDSSTVTCIAARKLNAEGKKIITASSIYAPDYIDLNSPDELEYINEVINQHPNIIPTFVHHSNLSFINGLQTTFTKNYTPVNGFYYVDEALYDQFRLKSVRRVLSGLLGDQTVTNSTINPFPILFTSGRFSALKRLIFHYKKNDNQPFCAFLKHTILTELTPKLFQKAWNRYRKRADNSMSVHSLPLIFGNREEKELQKKVLKAFEFSSLSTRNISAHIWPENAHAFVDEMDSSPANYQIEITYPLCDRRLIELLLQIPVEHFYAAGKKRGLIRRAMVGILPEKIRSRTSKGYYAPGYPKLIKSEIGTKFAEFAKRGRKRDFRDLVNIENLNIQLKNLSESEIEDSFTYFNWTLVEIVIWLTFIKSLENK